MATHVVPVSQLGLHAPNCFPTSPGPGGAPLHPTVDFALVSVAMHESPASPASPVPEPALPAEPLLPDAPPLPVVPPPPFPLVPAVALPPVPLPDDPPLLDVEPPLPVDPSLRFELLLLTALSEPHATAVDTQRARPAVNLRKCMVRNDMRTRRTRQPAIAAAPMRV
jgi:hypothetical protein